MNPNPHSEKFLKFHASLKSFRNAICRKMLSIYTPTKHKYEYMSYLYWDQFKITSFSLSSFIFHPVSISTYSLSGTMIYMNEAKLNQTQSSAQESD